MITICPNHKDEYPVPLISTMAFRGAECWCPFCGFTGDIFAGDEVCNSDELKSRQAKYLQATAEYLNSQSLTYAARTTWQGKEIHPRDLPQQEKDRLDHIRRYGWELEIKIESII